MPDDPIDLAAEGFLFGYPLVVSVRTLQNLGGLLGVNTPFTQRALSDARTRVIVAPNTDTLYAIAVLDLRAGPLLLRVPDIPDRYHTFQFLDAYTESFAYLGTRTTDGVGGTWVLVPPGWDGPLPDDVPSIDVPTPQAFLLGRVLVTGADDVANVTALTGQVTIEPLAAGTTPPPLGSAPGAPGAAGSEGPAFWDELGDALAANPPTTPAQQELVRALATLGVGPGRHPTTEVTDAATLDALAAGLEEGRRRLATAAADLQGTGGWRYRTDLGTYGDDLALRALIARFGWGANVPEEAIYPTTTTDADGRPLSGEHTYRIRIAPGAEPPAEAYWSLTLYGPDRFFVENDLGRYAVDDRTTGIRTADGGVEVVISAEPPPGEEDRWLPAPPGRFSLMLRLYLPGPEVLAGTWTPPPVERVS